jgi:polysaccharide export outer membrane protein/exopolysaccharide production protein ExoF
MQDPNAPETGARRHRTGRRPAFTAIALALLAAVAAGEARAEDYRLGPLDKLRLKIYEWRASRDTVFEWTALNDEYIVGSDGNIALPFVGSMQAAGMNATELGERIGDVLREEMNLGRNPRVAVEVIGFRPFYIVGQITEPGEYPYRPGLTVLKALGIAGGLERREEGVSRLEREVITSEGELAALDLMTVNLLSRRARLEAELAEADTVVIAPELEGRKNEPTVRHMLEQERTIFEARRESLSTQVRALNELRDFLTKEIGALQNQIALYNTQVDLVQSELDGVATLVDKGLAAAPREMALSRLIAEIQGDKLTTETALFRARQEISRTDISILELRNQRRNDVATELRETNLMLEDSARRSETALKLLHETELTAPRLLALRATRSKPVYTIVRETGSGSQELPADETTPVLPGDTVRVEIPMPDMPAATGLGSAVDLASPPPRVAVEAAGSTSPTSAQN